MSGIEYFSHINPTLTVNEKLIQNEYIQQYTLAIHSFLHSIYVEPSTIIEYMNKNNTDKYEIIIDCNTNDEIVSDFQLKFNKSVFLTDKKKLILEFLKSQYINNFTVSTQIRAGNSVFKYVLQLI
jgi:hypothetical protein